MGAENVPGIDVDVTRYVGGSGSLLAACGLSSLLAAPCSSGNLRSLDSRVSGLQSALLFCQKTALGVENGLGINFHTLRKMLGWGKFLTVLGLPNH